MSVTYRKAAKCRRVTCEQKKRFHDAVAAQRFVESAKNKGFPPLRWYLCPFCDGFHTTKRGVN